jgi:hypothetical protein
MNSLLPDDSAGDYLMKVDRVNRLSVNTSKRLFGHATSLWSNRSAVFAATVSLFLLAVCGLNFFQYGRIEPADILAPLRAGIVRQAGIEHAVREESHRYISRDFFIGRFIHLTSTLIVSDHKLAAGF